MGGKLEIPLMRTAVTRPPKHIINWAKKPEPYYLFQSWDEGLKTEWVNLDDSPSPVGALLIGTNTEPNNNDAPSAAGTPIANILKNK